MVCTRLTSVIFHVMDFPTDLSTGKGSRDLRYGFVHLLRDASLGKAVRTALYW